MTIADKLVLQRQHHLKWRSFDRLEMILMMLCGVLCFGFSLSVMFDIVTRTIGHPWLWLQEVTSTLFIYAIFIGAAVATRRNDHLYLTAISEALHGTPRQIVEIIIRLVVLGVAFCLIWFGYINYLRGFGSFRLPSGTPIASLYAAIPLAGVLVGELMSSANVVVRIANLSLSLVGHIRGGLSQVVVVFSMFFSEMSGSTPADVAVMSRALGGPMKREGYSPAFIAAIIASASTIAALVPPSITAVVYGAVGNVSIAGLFMAGVVPGMMIGFGLMIYCYFFGPSGMRKPRAPLRQIVFAAGDAALPLMIPVILLGGILTGYFTPTEAGVVAVIWIMPLVITLTQAGDINGVHMGVVLIATLAFGLITPPYGLVLLMASKFVGVSFAKALRAALPIYLVFLVTITFTIYFPKVVLWLPKQVIPESVGCFKSPAGTGYICPN